MTLDAQRACLPQRSTCAVPPGVLVCAACALSELRACVRARPEGLPRGAATGLGSRGAAGSLRTRRTRARSQVTHSQGLARVFSLARNVCNTKSCGTKSCCASHGQVKPKPKPTPRRARLGAHAAFRRYVQLIQFARLAACSHMHSAGVGQQHWHLCAPVEPQRVCVACAYAQACRGDVKKPRRAPTLRCAPPQGQCSLWLGCWV